MDGMYIEDERLAAFGASTARLLQPLGMTDGRAAARELRQSMAQINRTYEAVRRRYGRDSHVPAACEWLLDNRYLAEREGRAALAALRRERGLRYVNQEPLILALARSLLNAGHGSVSAERCRRYLDGFQSVTVLRQKELRLFPAALRAAALSALAEVCRALPYAADTAEHASDAA